MSNHIAHYPNQRRCLGPNNLTTFHDKRHHQTSQEPNHPVISKPMRPCPTVPTSCQTGTKIACNNNDRYRGNDNLNDTDNCNSKRVRKKSHGSTTTISAGRGTCGVVGRKGGHHIGIIDSDNAILTNPERKKRFYGSHRSFEQFHSHEPPGRSKASRSRSNSLVDGSHFSMEHHRRHPDLADTTCCNWKRVKQFVGSCWPCGTLVCCGTHQGRRWLTAIFTLIIIGIVVAGITIPMHMILKGGKKFTEDYLNFSNEGGSYLRKKNATSHHPRSPTVIQIGGKKFYYPNDDGNAPKHVTQVPRLVPDRMKEPMLRDGDDVIKYSGIRDRSSNKQADTMYPSTAYDPEIEMLEESPPDKNKKWSWQRGSTYTTTTTDSLSNQGLNGIKMIKSDQNPPPTVRHILEKDSRFDDVVDRGEETIKDDEEGKTQSTSSILRERDGLDTRSGTTYNTLRDDLKDGIIQDEGRVDEDGSFSEAPIIPYNDVMGVGKIDPGNRRRHFMNHHQGLGDDMGKKPYENVLKRLRYKERKFESSRTHQRIDPKLIPHNYGRGEDSRTYVNNDRNGLDIGIKEVMDPSKNVIVVRSDDGRNREHAKTNKPLVLNRLRIAARKRFMYAAGSPLGSGKGGQDDNSKFWKRKGRITDNRVSSKSEGHNHDVDKVMSYGSSNNDKQRRKFKMVSEVPVEKDKIMTSNDMPFKNRHNVVTKRPSSIFEEVPLSSKRVGKPITTALRKAKNFSPMGEDANDDYQRSYYKKHGYFDPRVPLRIENVIRDTKEYENKGWKSFQSEFIEKIKTYVKSKNGTTRIKLRRPLGSVTTKQNYDIIDASDMKDLADLGKPKQIRTKSAIPSLLERKLPELNSGFNPFIKFDRPKKWNRSKWDSLRSNYREIIAEKSTNNDPFWKRGRKRSTTLPPHGTIWIQNEDQGRFGRNHFRPPLALKMVPILSHSDNRSNLSNPSFKPNSTVTKVIRKNNEPLVTMVKKGMYISKNNKSTHSSLPFKTIDPLNITLGTKSLNFNTSHTNSHVFPSGLNEADYSLLTNMI